MTPTRVAALEEMPGWEWGVSLEAAWQKRLAELRAYAAERGRLPQTGASGLGIWVATQRQVRPSVR
jgi:hypothetical protein